jgi:hypothetical protein
MSEIEGLCCYAAKTWISTNENRRKEEREEIAWRYVREAIL